MSFTFLRWTRFGVAASLSADVVEPAAGPRARISVAVDLAGTNLPVKRASVALEVLGPADVSGVDLRQVVRTFPAAGTFDFENRYLSHIEFDRADLPWTFTPRAPDVNGGLRPWLCLVVVKKREGVTVEVNTPLPRLKIPDGAGGELPPLGTIHLWAHVQVSGALDAAVDVIAATQPERIISRIICPTALEADTAYFACLVPTYQVGVAAGLGLDVLDTATLDDAWTTATASIELPVYQHWEFATGAAGDFKSLVTRLQARTELPDVGTRALDVTSPGFGVATRTETVNVPLGGALRVSAPDAPPVDATLAADLVTALTKDGLTPPRYGRWHAGETEISNPARIHGWFEALNLDPRYRVAAGLGTLVVQQRQEDLMAAIWEQFGEIIRANQLLRQAQLAIAASERTLQRHFASLSDFDFLALAGPALGRVLNSKARTARRVIDESCAPIFGFSGAFRRATRTRGPLGRRFTRLKYPTRSDVLPPPAANPANILAGLSTGAFNQPRVALPAGAISAPASLTSGAPRPRPPIGLPRPGGPPAAAPLGELQPILARLAAADKESSCTPLDATNLALTVRLALAPSRAIRTRVLAQLDLPQDVRIQLSNRLDPIMAAPDIPTPMIGPLQELGPDWLLPGLANVPKNSVTLVEPDAAFIEAYLVGLNHEIGREMLWRGFPTDQRGTVFSRFWDRRGSAVAPPPDGPIRDIRSIATWKTGESLGSHLQGGADLVLLVRGDLLLRYPRATIFVQRAQWKRAAKNAIVYVGALAVREPVPLPDADAWTANVHFPSMSGRAGADVSFLGFPLGRTEARGLDRSGVPANASDADAGWFVVFQEQPTEPRFGYTTTPPSLPAGVDKSEAVAVALLRSAFRLFVHASDLVSA